MNDGLSVLVALMLLSAMLSGILTIAWVTQGRACHALTWAVAFGLSALQWLLNIAYYFAIYDRTLLFIAVNSLSIVVTIVLTIGFRQRGGYPEARLALMLAGVATILFVIVTAFILPRPDLGKAAPLLFRAVVLATAAAAVVPVGRRANPAERSMIAMLWLFILFSIAVAAVGLTDAVAGISLGDLDRWMLLLGFPTVFAGTGLFAVFLLAADLAERMRQLAARDPLTGILNRRGFEEEASRMIANARRHGQPLTLALADLDRFKAVNDMHGHATGDAVLRQFAEDVGRAIRQGDLFGRFGGEEFVLVLVNTPGDAAVAVLDRLRLEVATQSLKTDPPLTVTTSFGVAELSASDGSLDDLLIRADRALYRSKLAGRNCVTLEGGCAAAAPIPTPQGVHG